MLIAQIIAKVKVLLRDCLNCILFIDTGEEDPTGSHLQTGLDLKLYGIFCAFRQDGPGQTLEAIGLGFGLISGDKIIFYNKTYTITMCKAIAESFQCVRSECRFGFSSRYR